MSRAGLTAAQTGLGWCAECPNDEGERELCQKVGCFNRAEGAWPTPGSCGAKSVDELKDRVRRVYKAFEHANSATHAEHRRAETAERRANDLATDKLHPALRVDVQINRDQAYENGWNDGYAEGFAKASASTPAGRTFLAATDADRKERA